MQQNSCELLQTACGPGKAYRSGLSRTGKLRAPLGDPAGLLIPASKRSNMVQGLLLTGWRPGSTHSFFRLVLPPPVFSETWQARGPHQSAGPLRSLRSRVAVDPGLHRSCLAFPASRRGTTITKKENPMESKTSRVHTVFVEATYQAAMAAGTDAANQRMRTEGRKSWNEDDWNRAAAVADSILRTVEQGD